MSKTVLVLPLENPFEVPEDTIVDLSKTKFSEDFNENINTAFIYLRNIEYSGEIDFSGFSENELLSLIRLYMLRDIKDFSIEIIDHTLFNILSFPQHISDKCILDDKQIEKFIAINHDICLELSQLVVSIPIYIMLIDTSKQLNLDFSDLKHIENMPLTYECMVQLSKYDEFSMLEFMNIDNYIAEPVIFDRIFKYDNNILADRAQMIAYNAMYNILLNSIENAAS